MKRITSRIRAAIGAATLVAFSAPAAAQGPPRMAGPGLRGGLPAYLAEHPQALNLSDEQTARLRAAAQWLERSNAALRDQMRANQLAAVDSVHAVLTADQWQRLGEHRQHGMRMGAWRDGFRRGFARGRFRFRPGPWGLWWGWRRPG